jgi:hypothetical protein
MWRPRALKTVLVLVGLFFVAGIYPLILFLRQEPALPMMLSLYVTLGVFLLLAFRNPSAHRSLIAFTAWSSFAHATVMGVQAFRSFIQRGELWGCLYVSRDWCGPDRARASKTLSRARASGNRRMGGLTQ